MNRMARKPRQDADGVLHHVVAKGSGGESIVRDDHDRNVLIAHLGRTVTRHRWTCLAYCLLDSHFHLVVATPASNLGKGMQQLLAPYAREFNKRHERQGNLFHTRFYSIPIQSEAHLFAAIAYVALNPVRAGLATRAEGWRWSSHAAAIGEEPPAPFLARHAVLELFDPHDEHAACLRLKLAVAEASERDRAQTTGVRHGV
jgi:REP element-mobilizing transposase RayT